jgi:hypothetical protein
MPFKKRPNSTIQGALVQALKYARDHDEVAEFIFSEVCIVVTKRSHLAFLWSDYFSAHGGDRIGPREISPDQMAPLPQGWTGWRRDDKRIGLLTMQRLTEASR